MKINMQHLPPGHFVIMPTFQCNVSCEHCQHYCSPVRKETMSLELFKDIVQQVLTMRWSTLCISGGEPFLCPDHISSAASFCKKYEKALVIQTNGFWGKNAKKYIALLKENKQNTQLGFSIDSAHLKHIPLEAILQAIEVAIDDGVKNISVSVAYQTDNEFDVIQDVLNKRYGSITVVGWPIMPIGNARKNASKLHDRRSFAYECLQRSCAAQLRFSPAIHPDGSLHACYKSVMTLEGRDPFILGNIKEETLANILENVENRLLLFAVAMGGGSFGKLLENSPFQMVLEDQYLGVCHFCYEVLSNSQIREYLDKLLTYEGFEEKLQEGIQRACSGFKDKIKDDPKENLIVICNGKNCSRHYKNYITIHYLMNRLVETGRMENVSIEFTDCLDHCQEGPNLYIQARNEMVSNVDKAKIDKIVDELGHPIAHGMGSP